MRKIKTKNTIMFNESEREICKDCNSPEGFCKHTIEDKYKDWCPDYGTDKEAVWMLTRILAIERTENNNILKYRNIDLTELKFENNQLKKENNELNIFKKQIQKILLINHKD